MKLWIAGKWCDGTPRDIKNPFNQSKAGTVHDASSAQVEEALETAEKSFSKFSKVSRFDRSRLLLLMSEGIKKNRANLVSEIISQAGKPYAAADIEVTRAIGTFTIASEEAKRLGGDITPIDIDAGGKPFSPAISYWVGRGPVFGISPFNFPLNLAAHKVAPALAAGVSIILKPPPQAPGASIILAKIFEEAVKEGSLNEIPLGAFQVLNCSNELSEKAATDPRIQILSFTGSAKVGWHLQSKAIGKKVILELGGNAAVIINEDADLKRAATRCVAGGFTYSGQVCISVQRIFVHEKVQNEFTELFLKEIEKLPLGDPSKKETVVGPVIDSGAALRIENWIGESVKGGAKILVGGKKEGNIISPTVLTNTKTSDKIVCEEVFGPVVVLDSFSEFSEAVRKVNDSKYGLQAGIFTDSSKLIHYATQNLEVGGIIINEIPMFRADNMPYGGVKESGLGREGVKFTMEEFCERRTIVNWNA
jgi:acyl-CoA reductase-like NAD-dependent aldehyde dehydrogenase